MPWLGRQVRRFVCLALVLAAWSAPASAAEFTRDRAARAKLDEALERYLSTEFDSAESLLTGTIRACEERCRPETIARLWMYVGVVRGSGKNQQEQALDAFNQALDADPDVALDSELATHATADTWRLALEARPPRETKAASSRKRPSAPPKDESDLFVTREEPLCPPDLPGCVAEHGRCEASAECRRGLACRAGGDEAPRTCEPPLSCHDDGDCGQEKCENAVCVARPSERERRHWLGVHAAFDFLRLPTTEHACVTPYHCFQGASALDASAGDSSGGVAGGFARGTTRLLASYEYRFAPRWLVGARAGFAFGGAPSGFLPLHAELRVGARLPGPRWLSPHAHLGGGIAELDARLPVRIADADSADAYGAFGRTFVAAGLGASVLANGAFGLDLEVNGVWLFPDETWALEPALGVVAGF